MLTEAPKEFRIVFECDGMRHHQFSIFRPLDPDYRSKIVPESWEKNAHDLGLQIVNSVDDWAHLLPYEKQVIAAFSEIDQKIGPSMAYYEVTRDDGVVTDRYAYQTFGWMGRDLNKIVERASEFAKSIKDADQSIVWRRLPRLAKDHESGKFYFSCRLHVLPYVMLPGEKPEGELFPEA